MHIFRRLAAIAAVGSFVSATSFADLVPAVGPGAGHVTISHSTAPAAAPNALTVFGPGGLMVSPGGGYPSIGAPLFGNALDTDILVNVPVTLNSPGNAPAIPGITAAQTTLIGVGGGNRAGIAAPTRILHIGVVPGGGVAFNAFGGNVDYVNSGPGLISSPVVSFISGTMNLLAPVANFGAVGVRTKIEVGTGVGVGFAPTSSAFMNDIIVRFDGAGGLVDDVIGDLTASAQPNANTLTFSAASVGALLNLAPGATFRMTTVATLLGDPMSFTGLDLDPQLLSQLPSNFIGFGASNDAGNIVPEPAATSLIGLAGLALWSRRRGLRSPRALTAA